MEIGTTGLHPRGAGRDGLERGGWLSFARAPHHPGNLLKRFGIVGYSSEGRPIHLRQLGDPALDGEVLVFGCIHGDECAASKLQPAHQRLPRPTCGHLPGPEPQPRRFRAWHPVERPWGRPQPQLPGRMEASGGKGRPAFSGPRPFSEPETRLAARIVKLLRPSVTIWFHQHHGSRPLVRAWGDSVPEALALSRLARMPFRRMPWPAGTAPNWQNHRFPGSSSFVVELPQGPLSDQLKSRLERAIVRLGRKVGED